MVKQKPEDLLEDFSSKLSSALKNRRIEKIKKTKKMVTVKLKRKQHT